MPTPTYEPIATTTLTAGTASVVFSSVPQTYTDLVLVTQAKHSAGSGFEDMYLRFNSDTGNNYSFTTLSGTGSVTEGFRQGGLNKNPITYYGALTTTVGDTNQISHINNYSSTATYKHTITRANLASRGVDLIVSQWRSTSAITSITIFASTTNLGAGSTFSLYGIKAGS
jgi:hypothetical protein